MGGKCQRERRLSVTGSDHLRKRRKKSVSQEANVYIGVRICFSLLCKVPLPKVRYRNLVGYFRNVEFLVEFALKYMRQPAGQLTGRQLGS